MADKDFALASWFLGPNAENGDYWERQLKEVFDTYKAFRMEYHDKDVISREMQSKTHFKDWCDHFDDAKRELLQNLKSHFPFYSPRYIAHMLSEQSLPAVVGYFAGMLFNPNNVTSEAAPVTVKLELEVGRLVSEMLGYDPSRSWAHITSGGTIANLEALWVARTAKFVPFTVREISEANKFDFKVRFAGSGEKLIRTSSDDDLLNIKPSEAVFLYRRLLHYMITERRIGRTSALEIANMGIEGSEYNIAKRGVASVLSKLGRRPLVLTSASAHYSLSKAVEVLGYGTDSLRLVPVRQNFRMDVQQLTRMIGGMKSDEFIAAVVPVVGTTEEGAIDPVHEILRLRSTGKHQFWIHADAAWGGYFRSIFLSPQAGDPSQRPKLRFLENIKVEENVKSYTQTRKKVSRIAWEDREIVHALKFLSDVDSITVDPHKMGFIPYPAGIVAIRHGVVTELISQRAQYISDSKAGQDAIDEPVDISKIGPYILEGSKPGAAAAACWLAHTTIPLNQKAHGKLIRTSVLNARKLCRYLSDHRDAFVEIHKAAFPKSLYCDHPFGFFPLYEPDTNIVCFIAVPMHWRKGKLKLLDADHCLDLQWLNHLNMKIYSRMSIDPDSMNENEIYKNPFFVSRTWIDPNQYEYNSVREILKMYGISRNDYESEYVDLDDNSTPRKGLFVLRSTVMNPWYFTAQSRGRDYLADFVKELHEVTFEELGNIVQRRINLKP